VAIRALSIEAAASFITVLICLVWCDSSLFRICGSILWFYIYPLIADHSWWWITLDYLARNTRHYFVAACSELLLVNLSLCWWFGSFAIIKVFWVVFISILVPRYSDNVHIYFCWNLQISRFWVCLQRTGVLLNICTNSSILDCFDFLILLLFNNGMVGLKESLTLVVIHCRKLTIRGLVSVLRIGLFATI
jgi:hypothetical protein